MGEYWGNDKFHINGKLMAYFEKRATGWRAQVRRKGWKQISKTFRTKAAAERWAREVEQEMDVRTWVDEDSQAPKTLEDLLRRYLDKVARKKKGYEEEKYRLKTAIEDPMAKVPLEKLSPSMLARWRDIRLETVSNSTARKDLAILNYAIGFAIREWGLVIRTNPLDNVSRPPAGKPRDRRLNDDEYDRLIRAFDTCRNHWIKPIVLFAIETGMRRGEILNLTWGNINFEARTALLPETKNGEARTVPLSKKAICLLKALPVQPGQVFETTAYAIRMAFGRALLRAEIDDFRFHDLRHEATSRFFEKGLNVVEVASITGHKDLKMLSNYTHLKAEDLALKL